MTTAGGPLPLTGYADPLVAGPGDRVSAMVSSSSGFTAAVVQLRHGDRNPMGPGLRYDTVPAELGGPFPAREQCVRPGSYAVVDSAPALDHLQGIALRLWIWPTSAVKGERQGLLGNLTADGTAGFALEIGETGDLVLRLGCGSSSFVLASGKPLLDRTWYLVTAEYRPGSGAAVLTVEPQTLWPDHPSAAHVALACPEPDFDTGGGALRIGACSVGPEPDGLFNGRIDRPRMYDGGQPGSVVASWDLALDVASTRLVDTGPHGLHARTVNTPTRAVAGANWTGARDSFAHAPDQYGAIHFHDDDLDDAGWTAVFDYVVPESLQSGIYAFRVRNDDGIEDFVPFFVRPPVGIATADLAMICPTLTYLAYGNQREAVWDYLGDDPAYAIVERDRIRPDPLDHVLRDHPELAGSTYDAHRDGTPFVYCTWRRPLLTLRPTYTFGVTGAALHLGADLYLEDWLRAKDIPHDILTDHDLHFEGAALLERYRAIVLPSHPEYWTSQMVTALRQYLAAGGRVAYLGGNALTWVTGVDPERPWLIEVRKDEGYGQPVEEMTLSTTGERGGLWRDRGCPPATLVGVATRSTGWPSHSPGYRREPGSFDPRAAFVFEGVGDDETIGEFGLVTGGAAGSELDRWGSDLGTPVQALLLATSAGRHADEVRALYPRWAVGRPAPGGTENPEVRADMVLIPGPRGGMVFSVGSINWTGSLSWNGYDNNVSRITENVLRAFLCDEVVTTAMLPGR